MAFQETFQKRTTGRTESPDKTGPGRRVRVKTEPYQRGRRNDGAEETRPENRLRSGDDGGTGRTYKGSAATPIEAHVAARDVTGVLELHPKGYGFLRDVTQDYRPTDSDTYVPKDLIDESGLRPGNFVRGAAHQVRRVGGPQLMQVQEIEGCESDRYRRTADFHSLTPINPETLLRLETGPEPLSCRVIDLLSPLGRGQRGLIVAPPRSGKTILLQQIAQAIAANDPMVGVVMLLIDERPEEVTDMRRTVPGLVLASSLDQDLEGHVRLSKLVIERCKRMVERGQHVVLLIDSITRMARAFNKWMGNSGRTMTGGLDIQALDTPKKLFATARSFEEGGSLTILATALVETGSRMDDLIFEEFKGTGNLEWVLDRRLAERRIWPALDLEKSGTRREEKLLDEATLALATRLRQTLAGMCPDEAMRQLTTQLAKYPSNADFLFKLHRQFANERT